MYYVGAGQGQFEQESTYRYVGHGGDFSNAPRRRDFTCLIITAVSLLLLALLALWCLWPYDECYVDQANWQYKWSPAKQERCCAKIGVGCKPPSPPPGPVDPFNCALGEANWQSGWSISKKKWCCKVHHKGCEAVGPAPPANFYDCNAGFPNWVKGWSFHKKNWCCQKVKKGCIGSGSANAIQASDDGYGAGAENGPAGAPLAIPGFGTR